MTFNRPWDQAYAGDPPPWDIGRPQPAVRRLIEAGAFTTPFLDSGCGTGENTLDVAAAGVEATGLDVSGRAIAKAQRKAAERGIGTSFVVGDALDLYGALGRTFASVLDCGLFHTFNDADRRRYVASLAAVMQPAARLSLLCFSDYEPGDWGPRRVSRQELQEGFAAAWAIESIEPEQFATRLGEDGARAWLATIVRR